MSERCTGMGEGRILCRYLLGGRKKLRMVVRIPGFEVGIIRMRVKSAMPTVGNRRMDLVCYKARFLRRIMKQSVLLLPVKRNRFAVECRSNLA
jgi:hypothetical protein